MLKIEAVIKNHKLEDVKDHLGKIGVRGMTILDATDFRQDRTAKTGTYRGASVGSDSQRRNFISFFIEEAQAEEVVDTLMGAAMTGEDEDGYLAILPVSDLVAIATAARGVEAIYK